MVGFNEMVGMQPKPDKTFVKLGVVKEDKSKCSIFLKSDDFCVKAIGNKIRIDDVIIYSYIF